MVAARFQALLEVVDKIPPERIRPRDLYVENTFTRNTGLRNGQHSKQMSQDIRRRPLVYVRNYLIADLDVTLSIVLAGREGN
jgi:hypothetical protein